MKKQVIAIIMLLALLLAGCQEIPPAVTTAPPATQPPATQPPATTVPAETEPSEGEIALTSLRQGMVETPAKFAVAFLGYHNTMDSDAPENPQAILPETAPQLCADLPFLLEIPQERVIGEHGELYCIVPLDTDAQVAVSLGTWDEANETYIYEENLYFAETGEPILIFCNDAGWEPDMQVSISGPSGNAIWYPCIDDNDCAAPLWDENGQSMFQDFSPYRELLMAVHQDALSSEAEMALPTEEDLYGKTFTWDGWTKDGREVSYTVSFSWTTLSVFWNDGYDAAGHEYIDAPWELTYEDGYAVLAIDFGEFAGVLRYNVLYSEFFEDLYIAQDVLQEQMNIGWEPLYRVLYKPVVPDPIMLEGTWVLSHTEVEGDKSYDLAGTQVIEITPKSNDIYRISLTNSTFPQNSFKNKDLVVIEEELYSGCGNDEWSAVAGYTGPGGLEHALTLRFDGTLLLQNYWEMDGAPMVSYCWFIRAE